jgi:hypothetical protein
MQPFFRVMGIKACPAIYEIAFQIMTEIGEMRSTFTQKKALHADRHAAPVGVGHLRFFAFYAARI